MEFRPIGYIRSCFKEKFGTPRQSGLVSVADAEVEVLKEFSNEDAFKGLQDFKYIWLIFDFHLNQNNKSWYPTVRPPRLGGNKRVGVFATRSPFRPNPIGLSLVKLENIIFENGKISIKVSGHDLITGTPILDIKPYHPQADRPTFDYSGGWPDEVENIRLEVKFEMKSIAIELKKKITEILSLDPRPAYHNDESRIYGNIIDNYNIQWSCADNIITVLNIEEI